MCVSLCRARLEKSPHLHATIRWHHDPPPRQAESDRHVREITPGVVALGGLVAGVDSLVPAERPRVTRRIPAARLLAAVRLNPCTATSSEVELGEAVRPSATTAVVRSGEGAPLWVRMWRLRLLARLEW